MNRVFLRKIFIILCSLIITAICLNCYEKYLDSEILSFEDKILVNNYGDYTRDKGITLLQQDVNRGNILLIGSSELSTPVPENPVNMFPNQFVPYHITRVGRAYAQSLTDAIRIGSMELDSESKIAIVLSLQWFDGSDISRSGHQGNFSELQFYRFMNNKKIDDSIKRYICSREFSLLQGKSEVGRPWLYSMLNLSENVLLTSFSFLFEPYFKLRESFLVLKDKYDSVKYLKTHKERKKELVVIDWGQAGTEAFLKGKAECTNNRFYVYDDYYSKYLAKRIDGLKNSWRKKDFTKSKEMIDYEVLLNVCKAQNITPYIIVMSTNGWYYDYIGVSKLSRDKLYKCLEERAKKYGFPCLLLDDKEYEPYFYRDVMHLGRKGWLYVDKKLAEHYSKYN